MFFKSAKDMVCIACYLAVMSQPLGEGGDCDAGKFGGLAVMQ
jgi:hypothetical protein